MVDLENGPIWQFDAASGTPDRQVSDSDLDSHPFYNPDGTRVVYDNPELVRQGGAFQSFIFVQCTLARPQESAPNCRDPFDLLLIAEGGYTSIVGSHPVWTGNDHIVYKGCEYWGSQSSCGMFVVPSWTTASQDSPGENPVKLAGTDGTSMIPTDAQGNAILYQSRETGDWEVYRTPVTGGSQNLSDSPNSSDGLGAFSPDGEWIAFASDRTGRWGIWVVSTAGGEPVELFDLPSNPWATKGERDWTTERISWGQ